MEKKLQSFNQCTCVSESSRATPSGLQSEHILAHPQMVFESTNLPLHREVIDIHTLTATEILPDYICELI